MGFYDKLDPSLLEDSKIAAMVIAEVLSSYPTVTERDLKLAIQAIVDRQIDKGLDACVVVIDNIQPSRKTEVENMLKAFRFKVCTDVQVCWADKSPPLWALFQPAKGSSSI